jgi:GDPmannose 4,6-dehydratase
MIEFLLTKPNYKIHALIKRSSANRNELESMAQNNSRIIVHLGDITEEEYITNLILSIQPDEIYNYSA